LIRSSNPSGSIISALFSAKKVSVNPLITSKALDIELIFSLSLISEVFVVKVPSLV
jgi:hypothetical protein